MTNKKAEETFYIVYLKRGAGKVKHAERSFRYAAQKVADAWNKEHKLVPGEQNSATVEEEWRKTR
jgi:hypothetical protein